MPNFSSVLFVCFFFVPIPFVLYNRFMATTAPLMFAPGSSAIVIGSGLAGLSAASELVSRNISVHVLERSAKPGGNSYKASSGINGAPTRYQPLPDTAFYADTVKSAGVAMISARDRREQLIKTLTNKSSSAIDWLVEQHKVDLSSVSQLGGHSLPRTHRPAGKLPVGVSLINALLENLKTSALFRLETSCHVTRLLQNNSVVTGVEYLCDGLDTKTLHGPVIVASGGFGGDAKGLAQYRPDLAGFPSTNELRPGSVNLLTDVGAQLLDMEAVQIHPTGFVDPNAAEAASKFLAAEVLRGEGGLLLNASGRRFVDELQTRKYVTDAIMRTEPSSQASKQWDVRLVMDEGAYEATKTHMGFYLFKQLMRKTTVSELGTEAQAAVQSFAEAAAGKTSDEFGRTAFGSWSLKDVTPDSVVYVGNVTPVVHFTMGGALISERSEVLNAQEEPIKGVWAAGEVTGGVHGENRLGGSSLLECVVFGRTAGQQLAKVMQESKL